VTGRQIVETLDQALTFYA